MRPLHANSDSALIPSQLVDSPNSADFLAGLKLGGKYDDATNLDDIESIGYLLAYLVWGLLPWLTLNTLSNSDVLQQKQDASVVVLCEALPSVFATFLSHARQLSFAET